MRTTPQSDAKRIARILSTSMQILCPNSVLCNASLAGTDTIVRPATGSVCSDAPWTCGRIISPSCVHRGALMAPMVSTSQMLPQTPITMVFVRPSALRISLPGIPIMSVCQTVGPICGAITRPISV